MSSSNSARDFYGAGCEDNSRTKAFEFINGEPPVLLGDNEGANPVEFLLHALAGRVATTFVLHAMARGINICELSTVLEGDIDLQGLLGLDESVLPGYEQIGIRMQVKADCSDEELDDTHPCAIPCVGRSWLRSNESPPNQNMQLPAVNSGVVGAIVPMSAYGTKLNSALGCCEVSN